MGDDRCRPGLRPQRLSQYFLELPRTSQDPPRTLHDSPKQSLKNACGIGQKPPKDLCTISPKFPKAGVPVCPRKVSNILQVGCTTYQGTDPRIAQELAKIPSGICTISRRKPPKNTTNMPKNPPGTLPDFAKHSPRQLPTPIPTNWPTSLISGRCPQGFFRQPPEGGPQKFNHTQK